VVPGPRPAALVPAAPARLRIVSRNGTTVPAHLVIPPAFRARPGCGSRCPRGHESGCPRERGSPKSCRPAELVGQQPRRATSTRPSGTSWASASTAPTRTPTKPGADRLLSRPSRRPGVICLLAARRLDRPVREWSSFAPVHRLIRAPADTPASCHPWGRLARPICGLVSGPGVWRDHGDIGCVRVMNILGRCGAG
jgi:hypothetical protein